MTFIWLVFHEHIEDLEFVSAHSTEAGAEAVVLGWEDCWYNGMGELVGGKVIEKVVLCP